jgi:hypothetical protein
MAEPDPTLVKRLAWEFSDVLHYELSEEELEEAVRLNAEEPEGSGVCHTHDHIDANEAMIVAFTVVVGREPFNIERENDPDMDLINAAWSLASSKGFNTSVKYHEEP